MNDFIEENKKTILLIIVLIVATIIISIASLFMGNKQKNPKPQDAMKELGEIYYEELYYDKLAELYPDNYITYLESKAGDGIKVSLLDLISAIPSANLDVYNDKKGNFICDLYESYVVITPYSSYDREDYSVKAFAKCDGVIIFDDDSSINNDSQGSDGGSEADV